MFLEFVIFNVYLAIFVFFLGWLLLFCILQASSGHCSKMSWLKAGKSCIWNGMVGAQGEVRELRIQQAHCLESGLTHRPDGESILTLTLSDPVLGGEGLGGLDTLKVEDEATLGPKMVSRANLRVGHLLGAVLMLSPSFIEERGVCVAKGLRVTFGNGSRAWG